MTNEEKKILIQCLELLRLDYQKTEDILRQFKWISHKHLPQHGEEYVKNLNVFEIEDKTIADLKKELNKKEAFLLSLINSK